MFKNHKVNNIYYINSNCVYIQKIRRQTFSKIHNGKVIKTSKNLLFNSQNLFGSWDTFKFFGQKCSISKAQRLKMEEYCHK